MKESLLHYSPLLITLAFTVAGLTILVRMLNCATRQREQELDLRQQRALLFDRIRWGREHGAGSKAPASGIQPPSSGSLRPAPCFLPAQRAALKPIAPSTRTDRASIATSTRRAVPTLPLCRLENASAKRPLRLAMGKA